MNSVLKRRGLVAVALALTVATALVLPALSVAETGGFDTPVQLSGLPWSQDATGSLVTTSVAGKTYYVYNYRVPVSKGKTVSFTSTTLTDGSFMALEAPYRAQAMIISDPVSPGVEKLTFMAPKWGNYYLTIYGSKVETFTISGAEIATQKYKMTSLVVPGSKKKGKAFTVSVKVWPGYNSVFSPIKFEVQRKVGKKMKSYSTVNSDGVGDDSRYTKFAAKVKIKKKGTFRIRAKFSDAAHAKATYTGWKTIKIK
jgi:hypothetical protein